MAGIIAAIVVCAVAAVYSGGGTALVMIGLICMLIYMLDAYLPGIAEILTMITAFMIELVMTILTWLGPLGWLLLRAALLVLIWIGFAKILLIVYCILAIFICIVEILKNFIDLDVNMSKTEVSIDGYVSLYFGFNICSEYHNFFDLDYPTINVYFGVSFVDVGLKYNYFEIDLQTPNFNLDLISGLFNSNSTGSSSTSHEYEAKSSKIKTSSDSNENDDLIILRNILNLISGIGDGMGVAGGVVGIVSSILYLIKDTRDTTKPYFIIFAGILIFVTSIILLIIKLYLKPNFWYLRGLGIGLFASGITFLIIGYLIQKNPQINKDFHDHTFSEDDYKDLGKVDFILASIGLWLISSELYAYINNETLGKELFESDEYLINSTRFSCTAGVISWLVAIEALVTLGGHADREIGGKKGTGKDIDNPSRDLKGLVSYGFGFLGILFGIIFIAISIQMEEDEQN